jgi:hypothetical protein
VPENYFDVVYTDYYVSKETQEGLEGISKLKSGELNPIEMLYSN